MNFKPFIHTYKKTIKRRNKSLYSYPVTVSLRHFQSHNSADKRFGALNQQISMLKDEPSEMSPKNDFTQGRYAEKGSKLTRSNVWNLIRIKCRERPLSNLVAPIRWMVNILRRLIYIFRWGVIFWIVYQWKRWSQPRWRRRWIKSVITSYSLQCLYVTCMIWVLLSSGGWRKIYSLIRQSPANLSEDPIAVNKSN
jgi:hypothetical protein